MPVMLSRVAESIYWMNRYMERAENYARMLDENFNLSLELPPDFPEQWLPIVLTTGDHEGFKKKYNDEDRESVIEFLTFDMDNPNSILVCLTAARENARSVREIISSEMWRQINDLYLFVRGKARDSAAGRFEDPREFFSELKMGCHLFSGITDATMSHGEAWQFGKLGRYLERADMTSRILDMKYYILLPSSGHVGLAVDFLHWTALLRSASAYEMYRKVNGKPEPGKILKFLSLDNEFPRAIHYCLSRAQESIHDISGSPLDRFVNRSEKLIGRLKSTLDYTDETDIFKDGVHEFMDNLQMRLNEIATVVWEDFFDVGSTRSQSQKQGQSRIP